MPVACRRSRYAVQWPVVLWDSGSPPVSSRVTTSRTMSESPIGTSDCGYDQRHLGRLAALVERPQVAHHRPGEHHDGACDGDEQQFREKKQRVAHLGRHHADNHVHPDLTARPRDHAVAKEHAADHQEQHHLLGPVDGGAEEVASDDVGEVQRHAGDQQHAGDDAEDGDEPADGSQHCLGHARAPIRRAPLIGFANLGWALRPPRPPMGRAAGRQWTITSCWPPRTSASRPCSARACPSTGPRRSC